MTTTREGLHLQPAQAIAQTMAALGCALWLVGLPMMLSSMVARRQWEILLMLPIVLVQLNIFLRYTLRAQRVYATEAGLEVFRAGSWRTLPWSTVSSIEPVSQMTSSPIRLLRVQFAADSPPVMFYGNAQTQVRFDCLMRQALRRHTGDRANLPDPGRELLELGEAIAVHSPGATRYVVFAVRSFLALCAVSGSMMVAQRQWSALAAHAALTAAIALFFYPALRTVNLFATREGLLVVRRSGERFCVDWAAVGPVETPRIAGALPTSMARLYRLRLGAQGAVAFFSDVERLRRLERHHAGSNVLG